jgi:hypothetical protein
MVCHLDYPVQWFFRVKNCANSILVMASASLAPTVNLTILQWLLQWESMHMVSLRLVLLHLLQLIYLWRDGFWDPHPVLDMHPRRLFFTWPTLMYKIHGIASGAENVSPNFPPGSKFCKLSCYRRCTAPFFLLIQIFGNNSWNRINFRCRNTSFQVPALFDTAAPMVPKGWWGRKIPWRTWSVC